MRTVRLAEEHNLRLQHTLFPLHPDTPVEGLTLEALFGGRMDLEASKARLQGLMKEEGLPYGDPHAHLQLATGPGGREVG